MDCDFCHKRRGEVRCGGCGGRFCSRHAALVRHDCSDVWGARACSARRLARSVKTRRRNLKLAASLVLFVVLSLVFF